MAISPVKSQRRGRSNYRILTSEPSAAHMDSHIADLLIVTVAVAIPSAAMVFAYWLRLRAQRTSGPATLETQELRAELEALRADLGGQLAELHERVDFAERLLAQSREPQALPRPTDST